MPVFEYVCSECKAKFELMRRRSERNQETPCPKCGKDAERVISVFSHYSTSPSNSFAVRNEKTQEKIWSSERKAEDDAIKNPDPLKGWRKEREKTLGVGPEKWVEYANEQKAEKQKKKDYGENYLGREV